MVFIIKTSALSSLEGLTVLIRFVTKGMTASLVDAIHLMKFIRNEKL